MKISLITLHYIRNYGSVLQTYATQKLLESMGHEVEIIDYVRPNITEDAVKKTNQEKLLKKSLLWHMFPLKQLYYLKCSKKTLWENQVFQGFVNQYLHMSCFYKTADELRSNPPLAEAYCVGSDQMWNSTYNGGILREYYLDFVPEDKIRFSISTSFGKTELPQCEMEVISPLLKKFKGISVREASGLDLLKQMGYERAVHLLDPTLLIRREEWCKSFDLAPLISGHYVLLYQLHPNEHMLAYARKIAHDENLKLIKLTTIMKSVFAFGKTYFAKNVSDFLSLICFADYVVTDSFHGTAFSLNFGKQVFVFYPDRFSTRLQSILQLTGQEQRAVTVNTDWACVPAVDDVHVQEVLKRETEKAKVYLKEVLSQKI